MVGANTYSLHCKSCIFLTAQLNHEFSKVFTAALISQLHTPSNSTRSKKKVKNLKKPMILPLVSPFRRPLPYTTWPARVNCMACCRLSNDVSASCIFTHANKPTPKKPRFTTIDLIEAARQKWSCRDSWVSQAMLQIDRCSQPSQPERSAVHPSR